MSGALAAMVSGVPGVINPALTSSSNTPSCSAQLSNAGVHTFGNGGGGADTEDWVTPATAVIAAEYQVKTDVTSGTFSDDPSAGSWIDLSTTRLWTKLSAGTVIFTLSIRERSSTTVRTTQSLSMVVT